jgi:hypothetical protein
MVAEWFAHGKAGPQSKVDARNFFGPHPLAGRWRFTLFRGVSKLSPPIRQALCMGF